MMMAISGKPGPPVTPTVLISHYCLNGFSKWLHLKLNTMLLVTLQLNSACVGVLKPLYVIRLRGILAKLVLCIPSVDQRVGINFQFCIFRILSTQEHAMNVSFKYPLYIVGFRLGPVLRSFLIRHPLSASVRVISVSTFFTNPG